MANWQSSNIVLTDLGLEILSKVQLGVGALTVSRIAVGSGRVDNSVLHSQTAVSSEKLEATLNGVDASEDGSTLNIQLNNTGLLAPFTLNQIGIYVTHVDYGSEVLYLIAQCDADTGDLIPIPAVTPTTLFYSIFMQHSGVSNITVTLTPSGYATKAVITDDVISTSWVGASAPYTQEHSLSGATANSLIEIVLPADATAEQVRQFQNLNLQGGVQGSNLFTLRAFEDLNTIPIPIKVIRRGDI